MSEVHNNTANRCNKHQDPNAHQVKKLCSSLNFILYPNNTWLSDTCSNPFIVLFYHGATAPPPPQWAKASSLSRTQDHIQLHKPHSVGVLWTSDQPQAERHLWYRRVWTNNISKQAAADPRLRPLGYWDRHPLYIKPTDSARGPRWRSWLRHCATSQKVAGSIPDGVIGIFQPLTEMSTGNISWG